MDDVIKTAEVFKFDAKVDFSSNGIVSKSIIQKPAGNLSLFAFDSGQELSEHSAPFDAVVQVLEGEAEIIINHEPFTVKAGETIIMPANKPHAVIARKQFKMLLTMIKE